MKFTRGGLKWIGHAANNQERLSEPSAAQHERESIRAGSPPEISED